MKGCSINKTLREELSTSRRACEEKVGDSRLGGCRHVNQLRTQQYGGCAVSLRDKGCL
ncbi:hypothetical protein BDY21DRAFT_356959 [Lineolata rhizophorae]|uniref:Uncharacterized protein n=2 Tax=Lineolata rhizophorae TaxID=578093 RepID=A0A6A6NMR8_9PEZI|nr:hypothetical protein BDY21DRAFT_356959 [Lineolata rhizophorae]